jgi:hypothetical protein
VPYYIAFGFSEESVALIQTHESLAEIFFILDTCMRFNLGYYESGYLIMSRPKIVKNYFKGEFWKNFACSIPICIAEQMTPISPNIAASFYILKLLRVQKLG